MFEKTRIKYNEETGVKTVERYNPVKETIGKIAYKTGEAVATATNFIADNSTAIQICIGGSLFILIYGFGKGVNFTNKRMLEGWKDDGYMCRGDGLVFKKKMTFSTMVITPRKVGKTKT